jgi:hypothetical protein
VQPDGQSQGQAPLLEKLEWVKSLLELILLALAIPWVLIRLLKDPIKGLRDLGEGHFG